MKLGDVFDWLAQLDMRDVLMLYGLGVLTLFAIGICIALLVWAWSISPLLAITSFFVATAIIAINVASDDIEFL